VPCEQSPFAECDGSCPAGEVCAPNSATGECVCTPDIPCEQGPFPECLGPCPAGLACRHDDATGECACTAEVACQQSPFPECQGPCPAGTVCREGTSDCLCADEDTPAGGTPDGGGVPGAPLTLQKETSFEGDGADITLSWSASCMPTDDDYEIYEGLVGSYYSHELRFCSTGGATTLTFTPADGSRYYLVVPRNATREGSYGTDSGLNDRPQGAPACLPQSLGVCP